MPVLQRMEQRGVLIDRELLRRRAASSRGSCTSCSEQAHRKPAHEFNLDSPKQLQQILFEKLRTAGHCARRRPASRRPPRTCSRSWRRARAAAARSSTTARWRSCTPPTPTSCRSRSTPRTGRMHTSYHQAVAATGRLSSADPNLQNIPIRTEEGRRIRQAFIAPPGYVLMAADYSQIELRIMAHLSGDAGLLAAFAEDRDVHQATAAEVFGVPLEAGHRRPAPRRQGDQLRPDLRHVAPSAWRASSASIAARRRDTWSATSRAIRACGDSWTRRASRRARDGYVETVFGRRLYLPDISSRNQHSCSSAPSAPPSTRRCRAPRPTSSSAR